MLPEIFTYYPTLYHFDDSYQIMIPMEKPALLWIKVGERNYYDHFAGTLRSENPVHRITVPQAALDEAGTYTLCWRTVIDRKPYYPESEPEQQHTIPFRKIGENPKFFHVSDVHGAIDTAIEAAKIMPDMDALIMNGDITNFLDREEHCMRFLKLSGTVTKGEVPVIFARGNHDSRGRRAEILTDYIPHREGRTYYTLRAGSFWALILDCGEDKPDSSVEYEGTVCFHQFREAENEFFKEVVAAKEYNDPAIRYKAVIAHHPFCHVPRPPFDIEQELYGEWCRALREEIRPDVMISGHTHDPGLFLPGGKLDQLGQTWPVCIGGNPDGKHEAVYRAATYHFTPEGIRFALIDKECNIVEEHFLAKVAKA